MHAGEVFTVGHGVRPAAELVETVREAGRETLVDVRRHPFSRRNPQFNQGALRAVLAELGIEYRHAPELGGLRSNEEGEEAFACVRIAAYRSYAARMRREEWQAALARELAQPAPVFMCSESRWERCHRRLISDFLSARGHEVVHLLGPGQQDCHRLYHGCEGRDGRLYICGHLIG
jgi:uncharacterized protein (DUF488 family)